MNKPFKPSEDFEAIMLAAREQELSEQSANDDFNENIAAELSDDLERSLANDNGVQRIRPESSLEDHADFHRRSEAAYRQRAADAKREGKEELARIAAEEKALREAHRKALERISDLKALTKADTEKRVSEALCLAEGSRANCAAIDKHL